MTIAIGMICTILCVLAFVLVATGLASNNKYLTTAGIILVAIWGCCVTVH